MLYCIRAYSAAAINCRCSAETACVILLLAILEILHIRKHRTPAGGISEEYKATGVEEVLKGYPLLLGR